MLTFPIKMMFWKIVERMQVRARVSTPTVSPVSLRRDQRFAPASSALERAGLGPPPVPPTRGTGHRSGSSLSTHRHGGQRDGGVSITAL